MPRLAPAKFRRIVWAYYRAHGRHDLPWRKTREPYKILVSEAMLQQTQVERVRPLYESFLKKFPTAKKLAAAPLSEVLKAWQGLGYNRRAKMLRQAAQEIAAHGAPKTVEAWKQLPGVGPYTARAVVAFAFDEPGILIETNIRTAVLHHFFPKRAGVSDREIEKALAACAPEGKAREWNYALMDYGAFLKRAGVRLNAKSKHYAKQSRFAGSNRQARGALLRELAKGPTHAARLYGLLGDDRKGQTREALDQLTREGFVTTRSGTYALAHD